MSEHVNVVGLTRAEAEYEFRKRVGSVDFAITGRTTPNLKSGRGRLHDYPNKGVRKWVAKYYVYTYLYKHDDIYVGMRKVDEADNKSDAIELGHKYATEQQIYVTIRLVRVIENGVNLIADIEPIMPYGHPVWTFVYQEPNNTEETA